MTEQDPLLIRLETLRADLVAQGRRVQTLVEGAFDAIFDADVSLAERVIASDDDVDDVDVQIERSSVSLLQDATEHTAALTERQLRSVLTIVKVNNELERIADAGVSIAQRAEDVHRASTALPETIRVMCNSVVGIIRDVCMTLERADSDLARVVLRAEDTVESFKAAILREAEEQVAQGTMAVDLAFVAHELANQAERIADHCTNIAEQVLYATTGIIVRHAKGVWEERPLSQ